MKHALAVPLLAVLAALPVSAEFLSVKSEKANLRQSPGGKGDIVSDAWRHTPLEVLENQGAWYKVRSFDAKEGWVHGNLLEPAATVIVTSDQANIRTKPGAKGKVVWRVEKGYPLKVVGGKGAWLRVQDEEGMKGWLHKSVTWGGGPGKAGRKAPPKAKKAAPKEEAEEPAAEEPTAEEGAEEPAAEEGAEAEAGGDEAAAEGGEDAAAEGGGKDAGGEGEGEADAGAGEGAGDAEAGADAGGEGAGDPEAAEAAREAPKPAADKPKLKRKS